MNVGLVAFLVVIFSIDCIVRKKSSKFYKQTQLPRNIIFSFLAAICIGFLVYGVCDVLRSGVSNGDKVLFSIFTGVIISIFIAKVGAIWTGWIKERSAETVE